MIVPTPARKDQTVAVITISLDNTNTEDLKKFHCSLCGHVVFSYYDTAQILIPNGETERIQKLKNALTEVMCQNRWVDAKGHTGRCKTMYILNRG